MFSDFGEIAVASTELASPPLLASLSASVQQYDLVSRENDSSVMAAAHSSDSSSDAPQSHTLASNPCLTNMTAASKLDWL